MNHISTIKPLPSITFGTGSLEKLIVIAESIGRQILVITGKHFFNRQKNWSAIEQRFVSRSMTLHYAQIADEPTPEVIDSIVAKYYHQNLHGVIAIGGGSALDAGKAVSAMLPAGKNIEQFLEGVGTRKPDGRKLPFVAVPTTAGTGSETSANAVITKPGPDGYKKSLRHDRYIPDFAIIDPELMCSCPPDLTAACSMDTFTQLVEGFLSTQASLFTDAIAWSGLEAVQRSLLRAYKDGDDLQARGDMAYAALCSGIVLANAGLGITHGLAPALGIMFSIPHGLVCGTLMAAGNDITLKRLRECVKGDGRYRPYIDKYQRLGRLFCPGESDSFDSSLGFVNELYRITDLLGLQKLSALGVGPEHMDKIITASSGKNNPVDLSKADIASLLLKRL